MKRVLILGRGGSGKSTLATKLSELTRLPVVELDKIFWQSGLEPTPRDLWVKTQREIIERGDWIMDGDLGPYDALEIRLEAADTIIPLDFSLTRCAWWAMRRGWERSDFWRWLIMYRRRSLPALMNAFSKFAPHARLYLIKSPKELRCFMAEVERQASRN